MDLFKDDLKRREFIKQLAVSGLALMVGCSKDSTTPNTTNPGTKNSNTTKIALHKTSNRGEGVQKVMELLDFPSMQGKHVILKPNFNTADPAPASTHNETLSQIITEIKNNGASKITLAERSYQSFSQVIAQKEIDIMANQMGFSIKNLDSDDYTTFKPENPHWQNGIRLPNTIRDAEYIVSTCCLKTHHTGVITMSLKLSVGILPTLHMQELHGSSRINSMIAEINLAYKPNLIIMDGVKTFISGGPSTGVEKDGNVFVAGTDRIAIDAVGTAILKDLGSTRISGKIFELEQIKRAVELKIGIQYPTWIEFVTDNGESKNYAEKLTGILAEG
jgi:uncharacterized protein (DUF362 family)